MIATSSFLTALECTKFVFGRGSAPGPTGELTALPRPPSCLRVTNSKGGREGREKRERGRGEERKVRHRSPFSQIPGFAPGYVNNLCFWCLKPGLV